MERLLKLFTEGQIWIYLICFVVVYIVAFALKKKFYHKNKNN